MTRSYCLVLCTCPDDGTAMHLAQELVTERFAACVNILPSITSVYPWEGKLETATEQLLIIKSEQSKYTELEQFVKNNHPYELPEIISVPITHGSPEYLHWITSWLNSDS